MTVDEAKKAFDEMKAQGADDQEILGTLYVLFQQDKIDVNELEALCNVLGYELSEEFKNMSPEDQKTKGYEEVEEKAKGVSNEEVEAAKEVDDNENSEKADDEGKKDSEEPEKADEEDEENKARRLFGFDK